MPRLNRPFVLTDRHKLLRLMEERNLSTRKLADAARISLRKVYYLASGQQPTVREKTANQIAAALSVQVEELFEPQERSQTATGP